MIDVFRMSIINRKRDVGVFYALGARILLQNFISYELWLFFKISYARTLHKKIFTQKFQSIPIILSSVWYKDNMLIALNVKTLVFN